MIREHANYHDSGIDTLDDGTMVNYKELYDEDDYITYGKFKKMVFANVK